MPKKNSLLSRLCDEELFIKTANIISYLSIFMEKGCHLLQNY